jgi:hypothetical protein
VLEIEILIDAWLGGALAPKMTSSIATFTTACSIIFGDLRFFYFVERESRGTLPWWRPLVVAVPVSCLVPGLTVCLHEHDPARYDGTFVYLVYELGLLLVVTSFCVLRARGQWLDEHPAVRAYLRRLILVECAQYVLWAISDGMILHHVDLGWLLRLAPNTIYYAAFVPLLTFNAPRKS